MQIAFILMGVVGLTMLFFGIKWSIQFARPKTLVRFPLTGKIQKFDLSEEGLYAFCILGSRFVGNSANYTSRLFSAEHDEKVELNDNFLRPTFRIGWKVGVEYQNFKITKPGKYVLELGDSQFLNGNSKDLEGIIKKTIPVSKKLFGIIFLVFGINMSAWGIMLGINPDLFG